MKRILFLISVSLAALFANINHVSALYPQKLVDQIEETRPVNTDPSHNGIQILNIVTPFKTHTDTQKSPIENRAVITVIKEIQQELLTDQEITNEKLAIISDRISYLQKNESIESLRRLVKELSHENYTPIEMKKHLSWCLKLSLASLHDHSQLDERVQKLYQKVMHGSNYEITPRTSDGHSPSFLLIDKQTKKPFAILKQSHPEFFSSFKRLLPDMPLSAAVWEHELIGYEQDQLFGFDHTPATMSALFINQENEVVRGTIQEFIPQTSAGGEYYSSAGADLLLSIPKSEVHLVALSGMFKGLSAGHVNNYILDTSSENPENFKIYEIDLEEMLLPYNHLSEKETMSCMVGLDDQPEKKQMMRESLILCRLWVLGLPQSELPFDRATLQLMAHPALIPLLEEYHHEATKYSNICKESWSAQLERVKLMQQLALKELSKESPTLSPRDFYLTIFGGEHLWAIAKEKKYPAIIAFNNLISDPYQHIVKDFGDPSKIPECKAVDKPKNASAETLETFLFLKKMM
jgi:hypothetical protein